MADIERIKADTEKYGGPFHPYKLDLGEGGTVEFSGLSLRDWFAGQALAGLLGNPGGPYQSNSMSGWGLVNCEPIDVAVILYDLSDAMLKARKGEL